MKTRGLIGRTIVKIRQSRVKTTGGVLCTVDAIELDNGTILYTRAYECDQTGPVGDLMRFDRSKHSKKP